MTREPLKDGALFRRKAFRLGVACFFLIMAVTLIFGQKGVMEIHRLRRTLGGLDVEIRDLERRNAGLQAEIEELETNPRAVEKEARRTLWLVKPGEKTIVLPRDRNR